MSKFAIAGREWKRIVVIGIFFKKNTDNKPKNNAVKMRRKGST
jgi:hypothetical protein